MSRMRSHSGLWDLNSTDHYILPFFLTFLQPSLAFKKLHSAVLLGSFHHDLSQVSLSVLLDVVLLCGNSWHYTQTKRNLHWAAWELLAEPWLHKVKPSCWYFLTICNCWFKVVSFLMYIRNGNKKACPQLEYLCHDAKIKTIYQLSIWPNVSACI